MGNTNTKDANEKSKEKAQKKLAAKQKQTQEAQKALAKAQAETEKAAEALKKAQKIIQQDNDMPSTYAARQALFQPAAPPEPPVRPRKTLLIPVTPKPAAKPQEERKPTCAGPQAMQQAEAEMLKGIRPLPW